MLKFLPVKTTNWMSVYLPWCEWGVVSICCLPQKIPPFAKCPTAQNPCWNLPCRWKTGFSDTTVTVIRDCVYPFCGGTAQSGSLYDRLSLPSWSRGDTRTPWDSKTAVSSAADEDEFECQHRLVPRRCFRFFLHPEKWYLLRFWALWTYFPANTQQWNAPRISILDLIQVNFYPTLTRHPSSVM